MNTENPDYNHPIIDKVAEINPDAKVLEPRSTFNRAIIESTPDGQLVYSAEEIIFALMDVDKMSEDSALEDFDYNIRRALDYVCPKDRPILKYTEHDEFGLDPANH